MKRKEERLEKEMAEVLLQNRRLTEPLQRAKEEVADLQKQLANYEKDKATLAVGNSSNTGCLGSRLHLHLDRKSVV